MMKLKTVSMLAVAVVLVTAGVARGSDCAPPPYTLVSPQGTDSEAAIPSGETQRTESVTLLVRGMLKSRSGAT